MQTSTFRRAGKSRPFNWWISYQKMRAEPILDKSNWCHVFGASATNARLQSSSLTNANLIIWLGAICYMCLSIVSDFQSNFLLSQRRNLLAIKSETAQAVPRGSSGITLWSLTSFHWSKNGKSVQTHRIVKWKRHWIERQKRQNNESKWINVFPTPFLALQALHTFRHVSVEFSDRDPFKSFFDWKPMPSFTGPSVTPCSTASKAKIYRMCEKRMRSIEM